MTALLRVPGGEQVLRFIQAKALYDLGQVGGLFAPISVGNGKTIIAFCSIFVLNALFGVKKFLVVVPANLLKKTARDFAALRQQWRFPKDAELQIVSYDCIGTLNQASFLEEFQPEAIIFDEVQRVKNKHSSRGKRFVRYFREHPTTRCVALTGTIMRRSLHDFAHYLRWCLKENTPLPSTFMELEEWAYALDEHVNELNQYEVGALSLFADGSEELDEVRRGFQRRLTETPGVVATKGSGEAVDCELYINALRYDVSATTDEHFKTLRTRMETPDGWPLMQAVDVWRHSKELALGLHYVWVEREMWNEWLVKILKNAKNKHGDIVQKISSGLEPMIESVRSGETPPGSETMSLSLATALSMASTTECSKPKEASAPSATKSLSGSKSTDASPSIIVIERAVSADFSASPVTEPSGTSTTHSKAYNELLRICLALAKPPAAWRRAKKEWAAFVRETLQHSRSLDSELQVANACDAATPKEKRLSEGRELLNEWRKLKPTFVPETIGVWHDDSALKVCAKWMKKPGIVWTGHELFARRLSALTGCKYYGAKGLADDGEFVDDAPNNKAIIVSIDANREGRNLQLKWWRNLVTDPPEGADVWEQLLGRTHRPLQPNEEVVVDVLLGCKEHLNAVRRAISTAEALRDMTGADQKLLLARLDWPSPEETDCWQGSRWN